VTEGVTLTAPTAPVMPTVLVVDDHRYVRDMVRALFEGQAYRVIEAEDGTEGLALAQTQRPDCVLLDVRMPGLSGYEVLDHLSRDPRTREIPVIMLTAVDEGIEAMDRALQSGAVDYLTKPMAAARMAVRVRGAIERRRLLQEVQELRANFTSMLVHDLRSPITVVSAYVDMLAREGAGPITQRQRDILGKVEDSCARMVRLIGEILDLSKFEAGKLKLEQRPLDLCAQAVEVIDRFEASARAKGLTLSLRQPHAPCLVFGDEGRLDQVLMNLLTNALKFTPRGGTVDVELKREGNELELAVVDSGPGIAADELPLLFERFIQGASSRTSQSPGTGLGLVICRHLVEAHGGRIWAESEPGRGARFAFRLPAL
jgi:signal transduction histidine kinase